jgi:hypothetical protein
VTKEKTTNLLHLIDRFSIAFSVNLCAFFIFLDFAPMSSCKILCTDLRLIPTAFAIFLVEFFRLFGFRWILPLIFRLLAGVRAVLGLPLLGLSL